MATTMISLVDSDSDTENNKVNTRGGPRNHGSFEDKRAAAMDRDAILQALEMECGCDEDCMWTLSNKLDNATETLTEMRRKRFLSK